MDAVNSIMPTANVGGNCPRTLLEVHHATHASIGADKCRSLQCACVVYKGEQVRGIYVGKLMARHMA